MLSILHAYLPSISSLGLSRWLSGKESACQVGNGSLIPRSGRSHAGGNGNLLQYSSLGNPMDRGAWQAIVHEVARVGHNLAAQPPHPEETTKCYIFFAAMYENPASSTESPAFRIFSLFLF